METWELAFDWRVRDSMYLSWNLFAYDIADKIVYLPDPSNSAQNTAQNAGNWTGFGGEAEWRWKISTRSSLLLNYAYQNSKDKDTKQTLGNGPTHKVYLRTDWLVYPNWYLDGQLTGLSNWERPAGDPRDKLDDTLTVDLTLRYKDIRKGHWNLAVGVKNLFDEDIYSPSLGPNAEGVINVPGDYPMARRSFWAEVRYRFD